MSVQDRRKALSRELKKEREAAKKRARSHQMSYYGSEGSFLPEDDAGWDPENEDYGPYIDGKMEAEDLRKFDEIDKERRKRKSPRYTEEERNKFMKDLNRRINPPYYKD